MSSSSREKAYAKRRYEDWQRKQADKEVARRTRRRNVIAALSAVAVVGVVTAVVVFATRGSDDGSATAQPAASASPAASEPASPSVSPSASADANNPCPAPEQGPGTPQTFSSAPSESTAKGKTFTVTLDTSCGPLRLELDGTKAPKAVASFVFLAKKGYFDNTPCHRLTTSGIHVLQCGDPTGTGSGGPGYSYGPVENAPTNDVYPAGTVAMARQGGDGNSMGSQFFLVYKDSTIPSDAAGGYTVMGEVTGGLDVLEKVAAGGVSGGSGDGAPARAVSITGTTVADG